MTESSDDTRRPGEAPFSVAQERILSELTKRFEERTAGIADGLATQAELAKIGTDLYWMRLVGASVGGALIAVVVWFYLQYTDRHNSLEQKLQTAEKEILRSVDQKSARLGSNFKSDFESNRSYNLEQFKSMNELARDQGLELSVVKTDIDHLTAAMARTEVSLKEVLSRLTKMDPNRAELGEKLLSPQMRDDAPAKGVGGDRIDTFEIPDVDPNNTQVQDDDKDGVVSLRSFDGITTLSGKLIDFDGAVYTVETVLGRIQIDALQVNCEGEACPQDQLFGAEFEIHGSNSIGSELMPALIEGYADSLDATLVAETGTDTDERMMRIVHENGQEMAIIDLQAFGSSSSFKGIVEGKAAVGMSSRRSRDRDVARLFSVGDPDKSEPANEKLFAINGIIAIVHPENKISSFSIEDLAQVFSGELTNWAQFGGNDASINIYLTNKSSASFDMLGSLILTPFGKDFSSEINFEGSNKEVSHEVASDVHGIGVTGVAFQNRARAVPIRDSCGIAVSPTGFALRSGEYPLASNVYIYTARDDAPAHARQIVDFVTSREAEEVITNAGLINLDSQQVPISQLNDRFARQISMLEGNPALKKSFQQFLSQFSDAQRLSTTIRFDADGENITNDSREELARLASDIDEGRFFGKEITLVGFSDSVGAFDINMLQSIRRASLVEGIVRASLRSDSLESQTLNSDGFGELLPVACNDSPEGRALNRRIEVWVKEANDPR